jgi:predicted transposase YbfD/YdcC
VSRRALADTDPGALDEQLAAWLAAATVPEADEIAADRVSVDGKTIRGAVQADGRAVHLLAAMSGSGAVLAQREVGHKTNEITQVKPLLDPLDLAGTVVTMDALHCQRQTARYIVEDKQADYIFTAVKDNQPGLFDALDALPWQDVPVRHQMRDRGHGRDETRTIQVLPAPAGLFPHAGQAFLVEWHVADLRGNPESDIAALGITSMNPQRGTPEAIALHVRGHWASRIAAMRNLSIAVLRADGWTNIAAGLRWAGRNYLNPLSLLKL